MNKPQDNVILYHVIVDRFAIANEVEYVEGRDFNSDFSVGGFYGGSISGVTQKIKQGWFSSLGINVILISPIFEQIHGWVPGHGGCFKHHAYHGYFVLDFTVMDDRFGSEGDFHDLVRCAHDSGILVWLDVVFNHPGYPEPQTWHDLGLDGWHRGWEEATPRDFHGYIDRESASRSGWWGPDWVRYDLPGYTPGGQDEFTMLLHDLPDFKTESTDYVRLPRFLKDKANTKAVDLPDATVRGYLIRWLTDWVRQYGIDGFRCDSAKHVEPESWLELKRCAAQAKHEWWERQPDKSGLSPDFCMVGEVYGHGVELSHYLDFGFDGLINFKFQEALLEGAAIDAIYEDYAAFLHEHPRRHIVSYISSHDTLLFDRRQLKDAGTVLLLAPGSTLIFYGDETARPPGPLVEEDPAQSTRSPMNWMSIDMDNLAHWRKLASFRANHGAIAHGVHLKLHDNPYVFARLDPQGDRVIAALQVDGEVSVPVGGIFARGTRVCDAYSGWTGVVEDDCVRLCAQGVVLLESLDATA